jgi:hypothetical protein
VAKHRAGAARSVPTRFVSPTSAIAINQVQGVALSHTLTAASPVTWQKHAGADQALFTLAGSNLSMTSKNFAAPVDANADNIYEVTLKATDERGFFVYHPVRVTITAT